MYWVWNLGAKRQVVLVSQRWPDQIITATGAQLTGPNFLSDHCDIAVAALTIAVAAAHHKRWWRFARPAFGSFHPGLGQGLADKPLVVVRAGTDLAATSTMMLKAQPVAAGDI
jgi:hypothetical protein